MRRLAFVLVVLAAACSSETARSTTTTVGPVEERSPTTVITSTTTSVEEETTTTTVTVVETTSTVPPESEGPKSLCEGSFQPVEPGVAYRVECFVTPFGLAGLGTGWQLLEADEDSVTLRGERLGEKVVVAMLAYPSADDAERMLESVLQSDRLSQVSEMESIEIDGRVGVRADVEGAEVRSPPVCPRTEPVLGGSGHIHVLVGPGDVIGTYQGYGVGACQVVRIVLVEVDGQMLMVLAGTVHPEEHSTAVAAVDEFLDSITFEAP